MLRVKKKYQNIFMLTHICDPEFHLQQEKDFKLTKIDLKAFLKIGTCSCYSQFAPGLQRPLWPLLDYSVPHNTPSPGYPSSSLQIYQCYSVSVFSAESPHALSVETQTLHKHQESHLGHKCGTAS